MTTQVTTTDVSSGATIPLAVTVGSAFKQQGSAQNGYLAAVRFGGIAHTLSGTASVNLSGRTINVAGGVGDTFISAILIPKNATGIVVTLTGFLQNEAGTAETIVLTGSTTADTLYSFDQLINYAGAASIIATNNANNVVVWHGAP